MLRWDGHFKYKFGIIHIKIARLRRASIIVSIFATKRRFFSPLSGLGANRLEIWFRMRSTGSVLVAMGS